MNLNLPITTFNPNENSTHKEINSISKENFTKRMENKFNSPTFKTNNPVIHSGDINGYVLYILEINLK